ncbi:uncharacterized protein LOC116166996 [Photinus pyralis]|nr:uncharacterized protein LOC116166996 [Photinus pyralis]
MVTGGHISGYVFVLFLGYGFVWCGITEQVEIQEAINKFANVGSQEHHLNAAPENVEISTIATNNHFVPSQRLEYPSVYNNVGFSTSDQSNVHEANPLNAQWANNPLHVQFQGQQTESPFTVIESMGSFIPSPEVRNAGGVNNHGGQPYYDNSQYSELIHTNPFLSPEYFAPIDFTVPFNNPPPIQANAPSGIKSGTEHNIVKSIDLTQATPQPIHAESAPVQQYANPINNFDVTFPSSASFYPKPNDWPVSTPSTQFTHSNSYSTIFKNTPPTFSESESGLQNQASVLPAPYAFTCTVRVNAGNAHFATNKH